VFSKHIKHTGTHKNFQQQRRNIPTCTYDLVSRSAHHAQPQLTSLNFAEFALCKTNSLFKCFTKIFLCAKHSFSCRKFENSGICDKTQTKFCKIHSSFYLPDKVTRILFEKVYKNKVSQNFAIFVKNEKICWYEIVRLFASPWNLWMERAQAWEILHFFFSMFTFARTDLILNRVEAGWRNFNVL
jgi:hypothetical protein